MVAGPDIIPSVMRETITIRTLHDLFRARDTLHMGRLARETGLQESRLSLLRRGLAKVRTLARGDVPSEAERLARRFDLPTEVIVHLSDQSVNN